MYHFFETIKIENGNLINLEYHQGRLSYTYKRNYKKECVFDLKSIIIVPSDFCKGIVKCRFDYNFKDFSFGFQEYHFIEIKTLKLVYNEDIVYSFKSFDRRELNNLMVLREGFDDILIVKNGIITDTSFSNIAFYDGLNWFTPQTPLLLGTCRQFLIEQGKLLPSLIGVEDLNKYKSFILINAMRGVRLDQQIPITGIK